MKDNDYYDNLKDPRDNLCIQTQWCWMWERALEKKIDRKSSSFFPIKQKSCPLKKSDAGIETGAYYVFYIEIYLKQDSNIIKENSEGLENIAFCNWKAKPIKI